MCAQVTTTVLTGGDAGQGLTLQAGSVVAAWNIHGGSYTLQGVDFTGRGVGASFNGSLAFGGGENSADDTALVGLMNQGGFAAGLSTLDLLFTDLTPHASYQLDLLQSTLAFSGREQAIIANSALQAIVSLTTGLGYRSTFRTTADGSGQIALRIAASGAHGGTGYQDGAVLNAVVLTAVPEPATYAMIAGALALGLVVWRRRGVRR